MDWTEERIETLKRMWHKRIPAADIANALGQSISRNDVILQVQSLNLRPIQTGIPISPNMLQKVEDLTIRQKTKNILKKNNIIYVGDLIQHSRFELSRFQGFGVKMMREINEALSNLQLKIGTEIIDWPPNDISVVVARIEAAKRASQLQQTKWGATFQQDGDHFSMVPLGDDLDLAAALRPINQQIHGALIEKARYFEAKAARLDNQIGWNGIGHSSKRLTTFLDRRTDEIPDVLGYLYPIALELGSFIEFDQSLRNTDASNAEPLDPEVQRSLGDLVRTLAPWLRSFPSIREADDEAGRFLVAAAELKPTSDVFRSAEQHLLLSKDDVSVFRELVGAAERGEFLGNKAGIRAKQSAANLVIGAVGLAGAFFLGAVESSYSSASPLVQKVTTFLVETETSISSVIGDLPADIRFTVTEMIKEMPGHRPATQNQKAAEGQIRDSGNSK